MFMNDTGPLATPCVELTIEPLGRSFSKVNPVPPPVLMNDGRVGRGLHDAGDRIRHIEHKAGSELAVWLARQLTRHGVLGMNSRAFMMSDITL
jgi:hypothetical protein